MFRNTNFRNKMKIKNKEITTKSLYHEKKNASTKKSVRKFYLPGLMISISIS